MKITHLICDLCQSLGKHGVLAHIDESGRVVIKRFHNAETIIDGSEFAIYCGCGNKVFYKKVGQRIYGSTTSYKQIMRIYQFNSSTGTYGTI